MSTTCFTRHNVNSNGPSPGDHASHGKWRQTRCTKGTEAKGLASSAHFQTPMMDFKLDKTRRNPPSQLPANYVWHSAEQKVKVTMPARRSLPTQEQSAGQLRLAHSRAKGQGNHASNRQEVFEPSVHTAGPTIRCSPGFACTFMTCAQRRQAQANQLSTTWNFHIP